MYYERKTDKGNRSIWMHFARDMDYHARTYSIKDQDLDRLMK